MARTPDPPALTINKSFVRYALEVFVKGVVILWLHIQGVALFFHLVWHNSNVHFREFMFRDFIDYWDKWGGYIQWELTPDWAQWIWFIPTWREVWVWVLIAALLVLYIWGNKGFPSFNFTVPRTYRMKADNPYNTKRQGKGWGKRQKKTGQTADDDGFAFDPSAFKDGDNDPGGGSAEAKRIGHVPYSERERRLKALADHPNTPEHEREIAKRKLREMGR